MRYLLAIVLLLASAATVSADPTLRRGTRPADCSSGEKIVDAKCWMLKRGVRDWRADLAYIYSIDENRGRFRDAEALADWIIRGDP